jgi:hypothetical protein
MRISCYCDGFISWEILLTSLENPKVIPLTCHGHSRPITHLGFSCVENDQYYLISASKGRDATKLPLVEPCSLISDNNPMLRDGITGDWYVSQSFDVSNSDQE